MQEDVKFKQALRIKSPKDRLKKFVDACKNKTKCEGGDEIDLRGQASDQPVKKIRGGCGAQQPNFSIVGLELVAEYKSQRKKYDEEWLPDPVERKHSLTAEKVTDTNFKYTHSSFYWIILLNGANTKSNLS